VLVELRGFEPLTSAMRIQGSHLTIPHTAQPSVMLSQLKHGKA
jgi:hypothetical protein